jgi:predicted Mrr-cat superfamily restriction endonuclease
MADTQTAIPNVYVVRAQSGQWTNALFKGGYAGIGWFEDTDLSAMTSKEAVRDLYERYYPDAGAMTLAMNVGQISHFLLDITPGDIVLTPMRDSTKLLMGRVQSGYYYDPSPDSEFPHRRKVKWSAEPLSRGVFSVPLQNTLRAALTVFQVRQREEILKTTGMEISNGREQDGRITREELSQNVIARILELTAEEFETLVTELLAAIGFEAERVGRSGDGGIDVKGTLDVYGFARVDLHVQVKRYQIGANIDHRLVKDLRGAVPDASQAAFVTTSQFTKRALKEATKDGFKRIGLINGSQLVDILVEHYDDLSDELRDKLRLRRTFIPE